MEVGVKVWVENLQSPGLRHTSSAYLTFVALDQSGNRVVLPPIVPETEDEKRRYAEAAERRAYRLAFKDKARTADRLIPGIVARSFIELRNGSFLDEARGSFPPIRTHPLCLPANRCRPSIRDGERA